MHLLVFLRQMGAEGTEASSAKLAHEFGIGKGSINLYIKHVREAILDLEDKFVAWPDENELHWYN